MRRGVAGIFAEVGGSWQAAGPVLPAGFGGDQVQVLGLATLGLAADATGNTALLAAGIDLIAAWSHGGPMDGVGAGGARVGDGVGVRAVGERVGAVAGAGRRSSAGRDRCGGRCLAVPAGTSTLAPGPGTGFDALAVSGRR